MNESAAFARCEQLARRAARNFYPAFWVLPRPQRRAMCALYAFMRVSDDLADEGGPVDERRRRLAAWRTATDAALAGEPSRHDVLCAFTATVRRFDIPQQPIHAVLDGVESDLQPAAFTTFGELHGYCYRVASAVGLCCLPIWGCRDERATVYAEHAGIAFQLTNILRDLADDLRAGRCYFPVEDWTRFGARPDQLGTPALRPFLAFQAQRAEQYYERSRPLLSLLPPAGRAVFRTLWLTYRGLLHEIVARDYDVTTRRVSLPPWRKLGYLLAALPARFGFTGR